MWEENTVGDGIGDGVCCGTGQCSHGDGAADTGCRVGSPTMTRWLRRSGRRATLPQLPRTRDFFCGEDPGILFGDPKCRPFLQVCFACVGIGCRGSALLLLLPNNCRARAKRCACGCRLAAQDTTRMI
jgi:hypothetical protein